VQHLRASLNRRKTKLLKLEKLPNRVFFCYFCYRVSDNDRTDAGDESILVRTSQVVIV
jgi:hypothetical protein